MAAEVSPISYLQLVRNFMNPLEKKNKRGVKSGGIGISILYPFIQKLLILEVVHNIHTMGFHLARRSIIVVSKALYNFPWPGMFLLL